MKVIAQQRGVVLVVALVMLVAITGVAVALMISSGIDNKMMSSAQEAQVAMNEAVGAHDEAYNNEVVQVGGQNQFTLRIDIGNSLPVKESSANTGGNIQTYSAIPEATTCPASYFPSSGSLLCTFSRVVTSTNYGENGQAIRIQSVVAQQILD